KYVVESYGNNLGNLGIIGKSPFPPKYLEVSHGFFLITAAFDKTTVKITPNSTTIDGHPGYHSGTGKTFPQKVPYTITLSRGQCYFGESGSDDPDDDISASIIESDKPIAVLGGHENAALGGLSNRQLEGRDFMIEQMIPVDFWDT